MLRNVSALLLVSSFAVLSLVPPAFACGDKFLLVGRTLRYRQAFAAAHPGSILIRLPSDATLRTAITKRLDLEHRLRLAGHHVDPRFPIPTASAPYSGGASNATTSRVNPRLLIAP